MTIKGYATTAKRFVVGLAAILFTATAIGGESSPVSTPVNTVSDNTISTSTNVLMKTDMGDVEIELFPKEAPISTKNFLSYVDSGFYDGVIFHRVIPGFMAQVGGFTDNMIQKKTQPPIKNEAGNGLKNVVGTLSMARTNNPDSATSQIFINVNNNASLDARPGSAGYAVFGKVSKGMEVINAIVNVPTKNSGRFQNVPVKPIHIISAKRL